MTPSAPDQSSPAPAAGGACALGVMIKIPRAGASKTRLAPPLTPEEAAALSACFLRDTVACVAHVAARTRARGFAVYTHAGAEEAAFDDLIPGGFALLPQRGQTLGERLFYAAEELLSLGYESLCLIGSDSPTLPPECLTAAVAALARPGDRLVLGPCDDGGYYLIGLKRAHRRLFEDIEWSTPKVLAQTVERAAELSLEVELLPEWYDVDDAAALGRLCEEMFSPQGRRARLTTLAAHPAPHTRRHLERLMRLKGRDRLRPGASAA